MPERSPNDIRSKSQRLRRKFHKIAKALYDSSLNYTFAAVVRILIYAKDRRFSVLRQDRINALYS